jgi:hypothetical protein
MLKNPDNVRVLLLIYNIFGTILVSKRGGDYD